MSILVVGSVAYDDLETPAGVREKVLGGSASHFAASASFFSPVKLVAVVGRDFEDQHITFFRSRNIDLEGLTVVSNGTTFRWKGLYGNELNEAKSLETHLGVFADFRPKLPETYCNSEYVFLAAINPELQLDVLNQIKGPRLVACDTRDFWITGNRNAVEDVAKRSDIFFINDQEARLFTGNHNLVRAAEVIRKLGVKTVVIKRGEHGAMLFTKDELFYAPAMPLSDVRDPTGAGDTFAGGFIGYLAKAGHLSGENLRRAMICGSAMASFNVEDFSLDRLRTLTYVEIEARMRAFKKLSAFEL